MINTRNKGNMARRKAIALLEEDGWDVAIIERTGRFIKEKDAFGVGDLLAFKQGHCLLVQVTCTKPHTQAPYRAFIKKHGSEYVSLWQMVYLKGGKWRIIKY